MMNAYYHISYISKNLRAIKMNIKGKQLSELYVVTKWTILSPLDL